MNDRLRGLRRAQAGTLQPVTCRCGSADFDQVQRAKLAFDRLDPQSKPVLMPGVAFICSTCQEPLRYQERVEEIRKGEEPAGPTLEVAP